MKLAYFSPLPPLPSSIADYSGDLVPFLARHAELDLFIDDGYEPAGHLRGSLPIHDYRTFPDLVNRRRYDICLYQMGNDARYHEYIYSMLLEHPGVVVLHQYVLHDLILGMTVQCGDRDRFIEEMRYCYGESGVYRAHL
ncbi:MAG: glycosyl transferase family 1, partial [Chloroflexi bacterium]|nr:glycosyl transferase family 1 [Chloroflexota bacterium]